MHMVPDFEPAVSRVRELMKAHMIEGEVIVHRDRSGRTTEAVEELLGIPRTHILKVIVFKSGDEYVAAIITGDMLVDVKRLERLSGISDLRLAQREEVELLTGFSPGGIPPFLSEAQLVVFVDEEVMERGFVVGSAGSEYVGVRFSPSEFLKLAYRIGRFAKEPR